MIGNLHTFSLFDIYFRNKLLFKNNTYDVVNNHGPAHWTTFEKINNSKIKTQIMSSCYFLEI